MDLLSLTLTLCFPLARPDHGFTRAVEDFVIEAAPGAYTGPFAKSLGQLGADCYKCREIARRKLWRAGDDAVPALFHGLRSKDAQIRLSSYLLLRKIAGCRYCEGTGICRAFVPRPTDGWFCVGCGFGFSSHEPDSEAERICHKCGGPGTLDMREMGF